MKCICFASYEPTLHLRFPEVEAIALKYPLQGLPYVGNHEARTVPKKRYNISLPYTLSATCI